MLPALLRLGTTCPRTLRRSPLHIKHTALTLTRLRHNMATASARDPAPFERSKLETLLIKRFFYAPAFEPYGGSALQVNIISEWRKHFIIEEEMLEIDTTCMTLGEVLKTSGHVDKFTDWMTRDVQTGDIFRADHLVEAVLEARLKGDKEARGQKEVVAEGAKDDKKAAKKKKVKSDVVKMEDSKVAEYESILAQIDNYSGDDLGKLIVKESIKSPETGNNLSEPVEFNLMFESQIGPTGQIKGYLRPETAQGHFVNFPRLLDFNYNRLPFASAQIGRSFRNEISPKQGLLRVREFTMAEIEHFVDPVKKDHTRFDEVKDVKLRLLSKEIQVQGRSDLTEMTIGDAVSQGIVNNETLGYFLVRIFLFLTKIGIDPERLRFRQHMANEMAHYASDCWDAEIQSSYGWVECVGCADRSAYDLTVHSIRTGTKMVVREALPKVVEFEKNVAVLDKKLFGPRFKKDAKMIEETINGLDEEKLQCIADELAKAGVSTLRATDGKDYELTSDILKIERRLIKETTREFTPNVIEPSFGIGRILYSLLEHAYWVRASTAEASKEEKIERGVLSLPPTIAPIKVLIVPLSANEVFRPLIREISTKLRRAGLASRVDDSGATIGKRYSRNDELGTPFGVTIDFASVKNATVTLRERDSTKQVIGKVDDVIGLVTKLCLGEMTWEEGQNVLPEYSGKQDE